MEMGDGSSVAHQWEIRRLFVQQAVVQQLSVYLEKKKTGPLLHTVHKNQLQMSYKLKCEKLAAFRKCFS